MAKRIFLVLPKKVFKFYAYTLPTNLSFDNIKRNT